MRGISCVAVLGFLALVPAHASTEAFSSSYGPKASMRYSRPTLRWEVWPGPGGHVTDAVMTLNGHKVPATYDSDHRLLSYTPDTALSAGDYHVNAKVVVDDALPVSRDWRFSVEDSAVDSLPDATSSQVGAMDYANHIRQKLGLEPFTLDKRLCAAALAHSTYLGVNNLTGHYETPGTPDFLGNSPAERLEAFGFVQSSWECVNYGGRDLSDAVQSLFDAPYHRIPFMQPGPLVVGAGYTQSRLTMEFEMTSEEKIVVSPTEGQDNVPTSWDAIERPDPFRIHGMQPHATGYPIVYSYFTPDMKKIHVISASLQSRSGAPIPTLVNTPENDNELEFSVVLIPQTALKPHTSYVAKVEATSEDGKNITDVWGFSTGD